MSHKNLSEVCIELSSLIAKSKRYYKNYFSDPLIKFNGIKFNGKESIKFKEYMEKILFQLENLIRLI